MTASGQAAAPILGQGHGDGLRDRDLLSVTGDGVWVASPMLPLSCSIRRCVTYAAGSVKFPFVDNRSPALESRIDRHSLIRKTPRNHQRPLRLAAETFYALTLPSHRSHVIMVQYQDARSSHDSKPTSPYRRDHPPLPSALRLLFQSHGNGRSQL